MSKLTSFIAVLLVVTALITGGAMLHNQGFLNANAQTLPAATASNSDNTQTPPTITVTADYTVSATPTKAQIQLSIETTDPSAQNAQQQNAVQTQQVMDALKKAGIAANNVKTISYSLQENTRWDPKTQEMVTEGYRAVNSIQVTVSDITQTGKIIDTAVEAGANNISSITFTVEDSALKSLKRDALQNAALEAKAKASAIASGLTVKLDKVQSANESGFIYQPYNYQFKNAVADSSGSGMAPTPIVPGDVEVTANLSVTYTIQ